MRRLLLAALALLTLSSCNWAARLAWDDAHGWAPGTTNHLLVEAHGPQANAHPDAVVALASNVAPYGVWDRLADCESGDRDRHGNPIPGTARWNTNTGNGYFGGLQFSADTWRRAGGTRFAPYAHQATRTQQITIASAWLARTRWAQWPDCSRRLGLR